MQEVDIVVIGTGPAGQKAAIQSAKLGKSVICVEKKESVGGVCVNTGTIPSKTLREAILHLTGYRKREIYGKSHTRRRVTFADLTVHTNHVISHEIAVTNDQLTRNGVELVHGTASFLDPHTVAIKGLTHTRTVRAAKVVIAAGTRPYRSDRVPFNRHTILDTDDLWEPASQPEKLPASVLIVGAGAIGTEYACLFAAMGVDVRLLDRRIDLLRFVDHEIHEALLAHLHNEHITLYLGRDFSGIREDERGKVATTLDNGREIKTDMLLFASGRSGRCHELNLDAAGVKTGSRGLIEVNAHLQTSAPHIYAAGDIIGFPALASTSMEQGRIAACHAFGVDCTSYSELFPYGIYTIPEISMVGKTEHELSEAGTPYETGIAHFREIAKGQITGDTTGLLKLLFDPRDARLLGVHIMGEGAAELIHIGQAVLSFRGSIEYFVDTVFNYPTFAEAYKVAALNGLNRLGGTPGARKELGADTHDEAPQNR